MQCAHVQYRVLYLNVQEGSIPNERKGVEESARECEREKREGRWDARKGREGQAQREKVGKGRASGREGHREGSGVQCSAYTSLVLLKRMCSLIAYSTLNVSLEFCAFTSHTTVYHIASLSHNQSALLWSPHACATDRPEINDAITWGRPGIGARVMVQTKFRARALRTETIT